MHCDDIIISPTIGVATVQQIHEAKEEIVRKEYMQEHFKYDTKEDFMKANEEFL